MYAEAWASDLGRVGPSEGELGKPKELQRGEHWAGLGMEVEFWGSDLGIRQKRSVHTTSLPPKSFAFYLYQSVLIRMPNLYSLGCPEVR